MKKVLILGQGGREHALAWKMSKSDLVSEVIVAPGNPGMATTPKVSTIKLPEDYLSFAKNLAPDLIIIGPEKYLAKGYADKLLAQGHKVFGPTQSAARLESSKIFSKEIMREVGIKTADFAVANDLEEAEAVLNNWDLKKGVVIKSDELADGKGVVITKDRSLAMQTVFDFMVNKECSVKSSRLLFEKCLNGKELSSFYLCHNQRAVYLGSARDYKRAENSDRGDNTGGMGCFIPQDMPSAAVKEQLDTIAQKTLTRMQELGAPFTGVLFIGSMIENDVVNVLEYNVRFGDPETQTLLPALDCDLYELLDSLLEGKELPVIRTKKCSVHVVMASSGYPSTGQRAIVKFQKIDIKEPSLLDGNEERVLFFAGVTKNEKGEWLNDGGRVLGVTCTGDDLKNTRESVYKYLKTIRFNGAHYRTDIGEWNV